jgi:hypothetical protein
MACKTKTEVLLHVFMFGWGFYYKIETWRALVLVEHSGTNPLRLRVFLDIGYNLKAFIRL